MTDRRTVLTVILFIGGCAVLLVCGSMLLTFVVIARSADSEITPTAVAMISGVNGLAGTALGALGALLVSTRSAPVEPEPEPEPEPE